MASLAVSAPIPADWCDDEDEQAAAEEHDNATLEAQYWDEAFDEDQADGAGATEWLLDYSVCGRFFRQFLPCPAESAGPILTLGCGNSSFSAGLVGDGYTDLLSIDFSKVVIDQMKKERPDMKWAVADARDLGATLPECKGKSDVFQCVVDKSLMDCMFYAAKRASAVQPMVDEVYRVLQSAPGGGGAAVAAALFLCQREPEELQEFLLGNGKTWTVRYLQLAVSCNEDGVVDKNSVAVLAEQAEEAFGSGDKSEEAEEDDEDQEREEQGPELEELYLYICTDKGQEKGKGDKAGEILPLGGAAKLFPLEARRAVASKKATGKRGSAAKGGGGGGGKRQK